MRNKEKDEAQIALKKRYKELIKIYHPDNLGGDARAIQAILNLPPRARAAFQFHRFENMTYGAIAKRMGISKESVKELMHRAIVRIAEQLEQDR